MNFEYIDNYRARAKVHGGWIVEVINDSAATSIAICFVPDYNHEWKLDDDQEEE